MGRQLGTVLLLVTGATIAFITEHCVYTYLSQAAVQKNEQWSGWGLLPGEVGHGKTSVYRYDGGQLVRLREFCTWTVHLDCVMLKTESKTTPIHIHDLAVDKWVSGSLKKTGTWEQGNIKLVMHLLAKDPELGFMDLGSHVGAYSLSVAKSGRKVVSVDPLIENVQRLCKSIQKGGLTDRMTIVFNPLSDKHTMVNFKREANNVGGTRVISASPKNNTASPCDESVDSPTVMLDDLIPIVSFKKTVMKMDIQEHEYRALLGATHFFQQINVTAILMEWVMMKTVPDGQKLVDLLLKYKFRAYEPKINGRLLNPKQFKSWPYDVLWRKD